MRPEITEKMRWRKVDGIEGIYYYPTDLFLPIEARKAYPGRVEHIETIEGLGARLSMSGYLDCTEWAVFDTAAEAARYLLELFYDHPEDELSDDDREDRAMLEDVAKAEGAANE